MRWILRGITLLSVTALVAACGGGSTSSASATGGQKIVIRVGHALAVSEPTQQAALQWADKVKQRTNGQVELQIFPNATLGSDTDVQEQARLGANIIANATPAYLASFVPDFEVISGPFLFNSAAEISKVTESPLFKSWETKLQQAGLHVLAFNWFFGDRNLITAKKDIQTPDDLRGQKIRSVPAPMWVETLTAMGASPNPMSFAEVYSAMQQGVVDGAEAPLATLWGSKLYEVGKHVSLTRHFTQVNGWVISQKYFEALPTEVQKILEEEAVNAGKVSTDLTINSAADYQKKLQDAGVIFTTPDRAAFMKATESVYTKLGSKWTPGVFEQVKQLIGN